MHRFGRLAVKRPMRSLLVIAQQIVRPAFARGPHGLIGIQIDRFVFETPPQPFDKHVVPPAPRPIHTDLNPVVVQEPGKFLARELAPLIGVENLRRARVSERLPDRLQTELRGQRVGQPPRAPPGDWPSRGARTNTRRLGASGCT